MLDRIDIHLKVPRVKYDVLSDQWLDRPSTIILAQVEAARGCHYQRFVYKPQADEAQSRLSVVVLGHSTRRTRLDDPGHHFRVAGGSSWAYPGFWLG